MPGQLAIQLAWIAFATVALRGLLSGSDFSYAMKQALLSMAGIYLGGFLIGELLRRAIEERARQEFAAATADMPDASSDGQAIS